MNPYLLIASAAIATVALVALRPALSVLLARRTRNDWWERLPNTLHLKPVLMPVWSDPEKVAALADPLLALGFIDIGVFAAPELPGLKIRFLLNEAEAVAAFIYAYSSPPVSIEFSVRYQDGTTTALVDTPETTVEDVPFFRVLHADASTPSADMYRRFLSERSPTGIKGVTRDTVIQEYALAYSKIAVWKKNKGLTVEELGRIASKLAEQKRAK